MAKAVAASTAAALCVLALRRHSESRDDPLGSAPLRQEAQIPRHCRHCRARNHRQRSSPAAPLHPQTPQEDARFRHGRLLHPAPAAIVSGPHPLALGTGAASQSARPPRASRPKASRSPPHPSTAAERRSAPGIAGTMCCSACTIGGCSRSRTYGGTRRGPSSCSAHRGRSHRLHSLPRHLRPPRRPRPPPPCPPVARDKPIRDARQRTPGVQKRGVSLGVGTQGESNNKWASQVPMC